MYAVQGNHVILTKLLIARGASVNARMPGGAGSCALELALQRVLPGKFGEPAIKNIRQLLDAGANPNDALWGACLAARKPAEHVEIVELFLERGANPDLLVGDSGNTVRELVRINARTFPPRVLELLGIAPS